MKRRSRIPRPTESSTSPELLQLEPNQSGAMAAWSILQQHDESDRFVTDLLADGDRRWQLSPQQRGLALDISSTVIRRRRTLDLLLEKLVSRPRANVEPDLWRLLQIGTSRILFSRTPDHAAVDTTVELARAAGRDRWCGFANGIFRAVLRLLSGEETRSPAADTLPLQTGVYRRLESPLFADPLTNLEQFIGQAFSLPQSLASRWCARLPEKDVLAAAFYGLEIPRTVLRINRLRTTVAEVTKTLEEHNVAVEPGSNDWSLRISQASQLTSLPGFAEGLWSVQDESAMRAAELLAPQPGQRILDLCAAPGGKSTHLAELCGNDATIIACDVAQHRLDRVRESVQRLGTSCVQPTLIDRDGTGIPDGPYDAVIVDVPCSNTGVLARRPEARWRFRTEELEELTQLQMKLLLTAFEHLRPGGRLIYSTCSIEPEETSQLVAAAATSVNGLTLGDQHLQLPGDVGDGAFCALLEST